VAIMLVGLILRGVAFEFRMKARAVQKGGWNGAFHAGSLVAALAQGVDARPLRHRGFRPGPGRGHLPCFVGVSLAAGYTLLGACWLLHEDRRRAAAPRGGLGARQPVARGCGALRPSRWRRRLVSSFVFHKWFSFPNIVLLAPVPLMTAVLFAMVGLTLRQQPRADEAWAWFPSPGRQASSFWRSFGLAFSIFPFVIVDAHDALAGRGRNPSR